MTTYKEIKGTSIELVSGNPSNPLIGQIWYDTSSNTLKGFANLTASWARGGNLNQARGEQQMQPKNIMDHLGQLVEI